MAKSLYYSRLPVQLRVNGELVFAGELYATCPLDHEPTENEKVRAFYSLNGKHMRIPKSIRNKGWDRICEYYIQLICKQLTPIE